LSDWNPDPSVAGQTRNNDHTCQSGKRFLFWEAFANSQIPGFFSFQRLSRFESFPSIVWERELRTPPRNIIRWSRSCPRYVLPCSGHGSSNFALPTVRISLDHLHDILPAAPLAPIPSRLRDSTMVGLRPEQPERLDPLESFRAISFLTPGRQANELGRLGPYRILKSPRARGAWESSSRPRFDPGAPGGLEVMKPEASSSAVAESGSIRKPRGRFHSTRPYCHHLPCRRGQRHSVLSHAVSCW